MNILFIMYDQLRFDYLSCAGHPHPRTLDQAHRTACPGITSRLLHWVTHRRESSWGLKMRALEPVGHATGVLESSNT